MTEEKKRVEKIEVEDVKDEANLSEEDLDEVSGGFGGFLGGRSGMIAPETISLDRDLKLTDSTKIDSLNQDIIKLEP